MTRRRTQPDKASSQRELARRMGVSRSTVDRLRRDGLKCDRKGRYDVEEAREFQRVRLLRARDMATYGDQQRHNVLELKQDRLQVDLELAKYKLLITKGDFISKREAIMAWRRAVIDVKNAFLGLGRQLAPLLHGLGPREIQLTIDQKVHEILRRLARSQDTGLDSQKSERSQPRTNGHGTPLPIEGGQA